MINERTVGIVRELRDAYARASGEDGVHLSGGQDASSEGHSARKDLAVAVLAILLASLAVFGWRNYEEVLHTHLDSICCGQLIAFPLFETGITPQLLAEEPADLCILELLPFRSQNSNYGYLADWPEERRERLSRWLDLGIRFEGDWQSDELALTLDVLDAFGAVYGEERFARIAQQTVRSRSHGWRNYLTVTRVNGTDLPAAAWAPRAGKILLTDGLFDEYHITRYYNWSFLRGDYAEIEREMYPQEIVIAHELGHVLIDGLRLETSGDNGSILSVEGLYARHVPAYQWPHQGASTNENLATEVGAWALGVRRSPQIEEFRANVLELTAQDDQWSAAVIETTPLPAISR
jgi:hypothetical protein